MKFFNLTPVLPRSPRFAYYKPGQYSFLISSFALLPVVSPQSVVRTVMTSTIARRLEGKTVVITGASSGIGRSTAIEFARSSPSSLKLVLAARRFDMLQQIKADIEKEVGTGVKVHPVRLDVGNAEEVRTFVSSLPKDFQDIDVLVNNA
jgi:3-hydroxy acid dehydrogenase / malonic semialdehyde reductase